MRARWRKIVVPAGTEGVKVNALIAVLAAEGEDVGAAAKSGRQEVPHRRRRRRQTQPAPAAAPADAEG